MKKLSSGSLSLTAVVALLFGAVCAHGQSVTFNFADNTSDGWDAGGFSSSTALTLANIGGQNYIQVPIGGFQVANVSTGNTSSAFFQAMAAAAANPSQYTLSYDWAVNTATFTGATGNSFLQLGSFVNDGHGDYNQDFGSVKEVQLNGAQLTSGTVLTGSVSVNMAAAGLTLATPGQTFFRVGLIENGDGGVPYVVDFTDITIAPVPTNISTSVPDGSTTLFLFGLAATGLWVMRRRVAAV